MRLKWHQSTEDCKRLSSQLTDAHEQINRLETKIQTVRRLFDDEVKKRKLVEEERNIYVSDNFSALFHCFMRFFHL